MVPFKAGDGPAGLSIGAGADGGHELLKAAGNFLFRPEKLRKKWLGSVPEAVFCVLLLILCLAAIAGDTYNPFIYFQF